MKLSSRLKRLDIESTRPIYKFRIPNWPENQTTATGCFEESVMEC